MAIRVVIVEDSRSTTATLCDWLETIGGFHVIGTAVSEMEATDWLQTHRGSWDVVLLDLMIDGGSGFNLITRAKQSSDVGRAIVFSAYATPAVRERCIELGAEAAFDKSESDRLLTYLENLKAGNSEGSAQRPH